MSIPPAVQGTFSFFAGLPGVIQTTGARLTRDAGLLPIRESDARIGLTRLIKGAAEVVVSTRRLVVRLSKPLAHFVGGQVGKGLVPMGVAG
jgi:hypothetical protein